jgi:hypothetical protein
MTAGAERALAAKELRALLPLWLAALGTTAAGFISSDPQILVAGLLAYGVGSLALGALSMGHEYGYRTVGVLLAQPIARQRVFLIKLGVLMPLLLILAVTAWYAPFNSDELRRLSGWRHHSVTLIPVVTALSLAPWLTMMSRSALAGVVFAASLPGILAVAGNLAGMAWFGIAHPDVEPFRAWFWLGGMSILCVVSAIMNWRGFMRLEAIEGTRADVRMPGWFRPQPRPPARHPVWVLIWKELHLQQMTFVIVLLFAIGWSALSLLKDTVPAFADAPLVPVTVIYLVFLSIVIGSLASAEERHLGVLQWQVLLPLAAWQQWTVKAGTALALGLLFGVGVPILLNYASPAPDHFDGGALWHQNAKFVVVLTAFALYVSSLSTSGLRAMVAAFPLAVALLALVHWVLVVLIDTAPAVLWLGQALLASVALVLAYRNHIAIT